MKTVKLDIVSDVMCPWCYIGKRYLDEALELIRDIEVQACWRPYQLDATLPPDGKGRAQYLNEKFGGEDRAREIYQNIEQAGENVGIPFAFDRIERSPNTLNAHRVLKWATSLGFEIQNELAEVLFKAFFIDGKDLGDKQVLIECAKIAGMDHALVKELLSSDADIKEVQQEVANAHQMGVQGVPAFIINEKYMIGGAQPAHIIAGSIKQVAEQE